MRTGLRAAAGTRVGASAACSMLGLLGLLLMEAAVHHASAEWRGSGGRADDGPLLGGAAGSGAVVEQHWPTPIFRDVRLPRPTCTVQQRGPAFLLGGAPQTASACAGLG